MKYPEKESSVLEFKREIPKNEQIIKTIIGFCNQKGGKLIIGLDNDGTIIGIDENDVETMMEYLEKSILEASFPPILTKIYSQRIYDKILLFVEVSEGMNKPYYLKKEGKDKGVYIRLGRSTLRANADVIEELKWESRNIAFDTMPVYQANESDLDLNKFKKFLKNRKNNTSGKLNEIQDALISYKIIINEQNNYYPTVCGILLFGKDPQFYFPEARIICNSFKGIEIGREVIASKDCLGTLDEQFQTAYNFIINQLYSSWKIIGPKREEKLEVPEVAIREIVMNAIIHRNYHIPGPNKIAIFKNRIEIFSQGTFPGLMGKNLLAGFTYLRNLAICKIFREMGLIENFGLGLIETFSSYEKAGLKNPEIIEGENFVKCILPRAIEENLVKRTNLDIPQDNKDILNLFSTANEITVSDVIKALNLTRPTATRKLAKLVKLGFIKKTGKSKGTKYIKL